jgi:hypothetical protein
MYATPRLVAMDHSSFVLKYLKWNNHSGARSATPPESGGEFLKSTPPQMRRGGAPGAGVV